MRTTRRFVASIVLVALVVIGLDATLLLMGKKPKLGLDLEGGLSVVLTAPPGTPADKLDETVNILRNRIDRAGVGEPQISREGSLNVLIELPGIKNSKDLLDLVGKTAELQFRQVQAVIPPTDPTYATSTVSTVNDPNQPVTLPGKDSNKYKLDKAVLKGDAIQRADATVDSQGNWHVQLAFKPDGSKTWEKFTGDLACNPIGAANRQIGIVLDDQVQSAPQVGTTVTCHTGINSGTTDITGAFTQSQAKNLALVLNTGALPVKLSPSQVQTVSPTLGRASLRAGLTAGVLGLILVMLYVLVYYRSLGLQTWIGLFAFAGLTYGLVVLLGQTIGWNLTLAGIAGLIVSIGITTDSYIVFFERVKEEVHQGKTLRSSIDRGFRSAFRTLWTADSVTFFAALILFILAIGSVRGFALTLGLATALDVALFLAFTYPLAALLARNKLFAGGRWIGMRQALEGTGSKGLLRKIYRSEFHIDFIGKRKLFLGISGALVVVSALALVPGLRGLKYGIDFRGGTVLKAPLVTNVSVADIKSALQKDGPVAQIQIFSDVTGKKEVQVQTDADVAVRAKMLTTLSSVTGTPENQISTDFVGKKWGAQITTKALRALVVFLIVVILYMSWRLEPKMAISGIVALLHDLVLTAGVYAVSGLAVTPATVIAILTILGYSLYDTVVVFDKIKENVILPSNARKSYGQIANESMNQVLMRSINTSLTTLLPVGSLLFVGSFLLGADTLRDLALALFVGIAAGTYSSIYVATPLLSILKEKEPRYAALRAAAIGRATAKSAEDQAPAVSAPARRPGATKTGAGAARPAPRADRPVDAAARDGVGDVPDAISDDTGDEPAGEPASTGNGAPGRPAGSRPAVRVQPRKTNRSKRKKGRR